MHRQTIFLATALGVASLVTNVFSQNQPLVVYSDALGPGIQNWSWATVNLNNASPVHSGTKSISVNATAWQAASFYNGGFDATYYTNFSFWAHGGSSGGQRLQVYAEFVGGSGATYVLPSALTTTWQQINIPLNSLGVADNPAVTRISIQLRNTGTTGTFYLDDIQFGPRAMPAIISVGVNVGQTVRTVDARHFGVNLAIWDGNYDPPYHTTTTALLQEIGCPYVRLPGGSLSDEYHWSSNTSWTNTWQWQTSFPEFMRVVTNANAQVILTVNHGSGSVQEAAAWVAYANGNAALFGTTNDITLGADSGGRDWKTAGYWARLRTLTAASNPDNAFDFLALGRSAPFGIQYWEIGNECYGTWERDTNALAHHAYTYAVRATNFIARMKAVDPTIKIGIVAVPGESESANGYTDHPAWNARTSTTNYGWTPVLLTTLKSFGVTPDFLAHHHYPQWTDPANPTTSAASDIGLLQNTRRWVTDATLLRQHITDYFGTGGTNIELLVTENNCDSGAQGRQSTGLVNGLYYADSLAQLLKTEFNGFVWWDFRNGTDTTGFFGSDLYGWRTFGDLGMVNGLNTRLPAFYAAKILQSFARAGDALLVTTNDYPWLSTIAARRANGAVTLLALNKTKTTTFPAQFAISGFSPGAEARVLSFGIPNDEAARTNAPATAQDISTNTFTGAGPNFAYSFAPLSLTLFTLAPAAPKLAVLPAASGEFVFQLQGQAGVPYEIQTSANLSTWTAVATNTLTSATLEVTNSASMPAAYWRAIWKP